MSERELELYALFDKLKKKGWRGSPADFCVEAGMSRGSKGYLNRTFPRLYNDISRRSNKKTGRRPPNVSSAVAGNPDQSRQIASLERELQKQQRRSEAAEARADKHQRLSGALERRVQELEACVSALILKCVDGEIRGACLIYTKLLLM